MLQYALYNKSEYVCTFATYKDAKNYKTYQFNTYGIKLKVKRTYA